MNKLKERILKNMRAKIMQLKESRAVMAQLRRGVGKDMGELPDLLGFVLPDEIISDYGDTERKIEKAMYTAITLYAMHQQGTDSCVSSGVQDGDDAVSNRNSLGHMIRKLVQRKPGDAEAVQRRFNKVLSAKDMTELSVHARSLIKLCKREKLTLDYPGFAFDLYRVQTEESRRNVLLSWGRDYYMESRKED